MQKEVEQRPQAIILMQEALRQQLLAMLLIQKAR